MQLAPTLDSTIDHQLAQVTTLSGPHNAGYDAPVSMFLRQALAD